MNKCKTLIRQLLCGLLCLGLAACQPSVTDDKRAQQEPRRLTHDAYIWQRVWFAELGDAIDSSSQWLTQWRVLVAQLDGNGAWQRSAWQGAPLRMSGLPLVAVFRLEGNLAMHQRKQVIQQLVRHMKELRASGLLWQGMEIDHDAASADLQQYALFLQELRAKLHAAGLYPAISVTALPDWLTHNAYAEVEAASNHVVLQLHGPHLNPGQIFDAKHAQTWVRQLAARSQRPFWIALPNYGVRLHWDAPHTAARVEAEAPLAKKGMRMREVLVSPRAVQAFIHQLEQHGAPPNLHGIVWFRLPTARDQRSWSLATWQAVLRGERLNTALYAELQPAPRHPGWQRLQVQNEGVLDLPLPGQVLVQGECSLVDGEADLRYRVEESLQGGLPELRFTRRGPEMGRIRAQQEFTLATITCKDAARLRLIP
ncbi:DUF3142 domain-containing protein [Massilia sp. W12]|uniref:DUF3142 domain-containing protein n=1 Tax=Massilia sp. W12 TaxID=3126507 RepID=UPI0030D0EB48